MSYQEVKIKIAGNNEFMTKRQVIATIDPEVCINCGKCRRICPTEAIAEYQRPICRICPDCADGPTMFRPQSEEYAHEHACSIACPLGTVPEGYVNMIAEEKFDIAYDLISELNPLPAVCARICHHPCEDECKRGLLIDKPIAIRGLKRFITDTIPARKQSFIQKYDVKIAIIGAGPAGIMAAFDLAKKGYKVKIFEAGPEPGGMMRKCIPDFRLDKEVLSSEIRSLEESGIEIQYNTIIGTNPTIDDLLKDNYAAILIAVGASKGGKLPIEGIGADRVYDAVSLMGRVNAGIPVDIGENAIVIGAGSVAIDTARTLLRLGAKNATCVCIESEDTMPAPNSEIQEAKDEGVKFVTSLAPTKIDAEWVTVKGVEFKKVERIDLDKYGRLIPVLIEDTEFKLEADTVVFATGQKPDVKNIAKNSDLKLNDAGRLVYDEKTYMTSKSKVFVAGDVIAARGSVIDALASGRKAAIAIDNMINERELKDKIYHELDTSDVDDIIYPVRLEKLSPQKMPKIRYRDDFEEIELGFTKKQAVLEAKRCMKCGFEKVDEDRCIGCGACLNVCPENAIALSKAPAKEVK